jgi:hypothetical protein
MSLSERLAARGQAPDYAPLSLARRHQQHYRSCGCLGDSAECCVPSCACHDGEPLVDTVDLRDTDDVRSHVHAIIDWWRGANEAPGGCSPWDAIKGMRDHVMALRDLTGYER